MDVTDGVIGQSVRRSQILHMYLDGSISLQIHYCNKARNQKGINSSPAGSLFHVPHKFRCRYGKNNDFLRTMGNFYLIVTIISPPKGSKSKKALSERSCTESFFFPCLADTFFIVPPSTTIVNGSVKSSLSNGSSGTTCNLFFFSVTVRRIASLSLS